MKKLFAILLAVALVFSLAACGGSGSKGSDKLVGVAMPTKDLQRWNQDGENMKKELEAAGYEVDLQYGANDIATQVSQIENMIANGCKVLVIASIDGDSLFIGMTMDTTRADMVQAVLEGVAFAIRDSFEVARSLGLDIPRSMICGGGSNSPLWRKIFANVLGIPLDTVTTEQGPGYGGAMLAMVGCGRFASVQAAADALVKVASTTEPRPEIAARYEERYRQFRQIYPALKTVFPNIQ